MTAPDLAAVVAIIAGGAYFQTVTGFGFGMISIGAVSALALAPVTVMAAVISVLTLVNSAVALRGQMHRIDWPAMRAVLVGIAPGVIGGVLLLDYMSMTAATLLKLLLGMVVMFSGVIFTIRPTQLTHRSGTPSFLGAGVLSGLFAGLFGVAGPPVILHFHRQPMDLVVVRNMLLLAFACSSVVRAGFVGLQGGMTQDVWIIAALAMVFVALATLAGRRYPPPLAPTVMRRLAFGVLIVIGGNLIWSAIAEWQNVL